MCATQIHEQRWASATGLLLLLAVERQQRDARHLDDLESHTRNITHGVALTAEPSNQHLILQGGEGTTSSARRGEGRGVSNTRVSKRATPRARASRCGISLAAAVMSCGGPRTDSRVRPSGPGGSGVRSHR